MEYIRNLLEMLLGTPLAIVFMIVYDPVLRVVAVLVAVAVAIGAWRYQRCPHCRRLVRRARVGWLSCPRCGRSYARGIGAP
ncbi:MAG: hypothetical protein HY216_18090 [Candidatus Rokubacteria bacterium]|nr:hypothetical protein [Candidatus Rokubacteria bacterium]